MTKSFFSLVIILLSINSFSQTDFNTIIKDGDNAMKNNNFVDALKKYDAAEAAYPSRKDEVKVKRDILFSKIAAVGRSTGTANNQIKRLLDTIQGQKETIKMAFDLASSNLELARINIAKSQRYINGLNLAKGNLAIVFNVPKGGSNPQYGFINKNGDVVIGYKYDHAAPFDYTGFARVKRINLSGSNNKNWEETTYLIDTAGREYPSAHFITGLRPANTALDLRDSVLEEFPSAIFSHPQLKVLLLQGDLQTVVPLPAEIQKMKSLECFSSLSYIFDSIPAEIGQLNNLRSLIISYGQLKRLPSAIVKLEKLQSLELSGNSMTAFPEGIVSLLQLRSLSLASNSIDKIPGQIGALVNLQKLDLQWNRLVTLPPQIGNLKNLQFLNLDKNKFEELPREIGLLKNLQDLVLTGNQLRSFPMQILPLTNLESLDLSSNKLLKTIPPEISQLKNLRTLKLTDTAIPVSDQARIRNLLPWCYIIF